MLSITLARFVCQLCFGICGAMLVSPPKYITSGFYRVHLWVVLGLMTFAGLALFSIRGDTDLGTLTLPAVVTGAIISYMGSVAWLYEKVRPGQVLLAAAGVCAFVATCGLTPLTGSTSTMLGWLDDFSAGSILGTTMAAMLLGHWYLNTPTMKLLPLERLIWLIVLATLLRAALCGWAFVADYSSREVSFGFLAGASLRWAAGLLGVMVLALMSYKTLKIPNTQSATGILYVAVICVFMGELASHLLRMSTSYPV